MCTCVCDNTCMYEYVNVLCVYVAGGRVTVGALGEILPYLYHRVE